MNKYDAYSVCVNPVKYTRGAQSEFAYEHPSLVFMVISIFDNL